MVNLGIGGVGYNISQKSEIAVGGGEVVTFNNANYTWGNVMYGVGVRYERYFKFKDDCDGGNRREEKCSKCCLPSDNSTDHCHQRHVTEAHCLQSHGPRRNDANHPHDPTTYGQSNQATEQAMPMGWAERVHDRDHARLDLR